MRCPKCGFVSYDLAETCAKCGKNINAASKELQGTVASIAPPSFLHFGVAEPEPKAAQGAEPEAEVAFDLGGEEEAVIDLGGEEGTAQEVGAMDLGLEEAVAEPEALGGPAVAEPMAEEPVFAMPTEAPQVTDFEISDLAPPQEAAEPLKEEVAEELEFAAAAEEQQAKSASTALGLADLKVEGIDLEAAPATGKAVPAVKTGTALDEFDIDLADLIPKRK
jgi:hypothetical protein